MLRLVFLQCFEEDKFRVARIEVFHDAAWHKASACKEALRWGIGDIGTAEQLLRRASLRKLHEQRQGQALATVGCRNAHQRYKAVAKEVLVQHGKPKHMAIRHRPPAHSLLDHALQLHPAALMRLCVGVTGIELRQIGY
ncbi:hypothetical protein VUJ63_11175 [Comamonas piscis]|nr:hypothetical protein [Comamonas piscis]WSO36141.1 hypothetical protein VUJ63_11175 [Comamonas piscis]